VFIRASSNPFVSCSNNDIGNSVTKSLSSTVKTPYSSDSEDSTTIPTVERFLFSNTPNQITVASLCNASESRLQDPSHGPYSL
jgi:hypothetical protein